MNTQEEILAIMKRKERATIGATLFVLSPFILIIGVILWAVITS